MKGLMAAGATLGLSAATAVAVARGRWRADSRAAVARLHGAVPAGSAGPAFERDDLGALPPPVARYLTFALPQGQPRARTARVRWAGEFRVRPHGRWQPFTALQHFSATPPAFVWDARIRLLPLVSVHVRDGYLAGVGSMRGRVAAVVPVVDQDGTPEIARSALARWLGEAVWFPTALLPGGAVSWEAVDDSRARATAADGEVRATAEFTVAPTGEITRMRALRYRDVEGAPVLTPFEGRYAAYQRRAGVMLPGEAEVAWELPSGRFAYWRGRPVEVAYGG